MLPLCLPELRQKHEATHFHGSTLYLLVLGCSGRELAHARVVLITSSPGCWVFALPASYKLGRVVELSSVEPFMPLAGVQKIKTTKEYNSGLERSDKLIQSAH